MPGREAQVAELLVGLTAAVRAEPGSVLFEASTLAGHPHHFFVYEEYRDVEAFEAHLRSDYSIEFNRKLAPLVEGGRSELTWLVPLNG